MPGGKAGWQGSPLGGTGGDRWRQRSSREAGPSGREGPASCWPPRLAPHKHIHGCRHRRGGRCRPVSMMSRGFLPSSARRGPRGALLLPPTPSHSAPRARQGPKCTRSCAARPHVASKGFVQPSAVALWGPASKLSADASLLRNDNLPSAELLGPTGNLTDPGHHLWALRPAGPRPEMPSVRGLSALPHPSARRWSGSAPARLEHP